MLPKSIRWRLPLSYAGIALLAALALGAVLLTTLHGYYAMREHDNLADNAQMISDIIGRMYDHSRPQDWINSQVNTLSFVSQARIQLYDPKNNLLVDSGNPLEKQVITLNYNGTPQDPNLIFLGRMPPQTNLDGGVQGFYASGTAGGTLITGTPPPGDQIAIALAESPFGVGLRSEISTTMHSDESVQVPIRDMNNQVIGLVDISNGPAYGTEIIEGMTWALIGAGLVAVVLAACVGWFVSRTITKPLLLLTDATTKMADGNLATQVNLKRNDEFGLLSHSFNEMAQRVDTTVTALRRFVADAAHQIHTPLTAVHADLELAASEPDAARQQMFIERALTQLKRLEALTNDLLDLSRLEARAVDDRRVTVDLVLLVREISEAFASRAEQMGIAFNIEAPNPCVKANVNETQFRHAICNLLDNAIKFTPENGTITVSVCRDGDQVELCVNDTGIGISAEDLPQLFNRFHRGRNAAAYPGSGLGLAIIKAIVDGHHGQISVQSQAGNGTHFALRIPAGAL